MTGKVGIRNLVGILSSCSRIGRIRGNGLIDKRAISSCGCGSRLMSTVPAAHNQTASPSTSSTVGNAGEAKAEKISQAMKSYLERAKAHDEFMQAEITEYEIGKRHLANIMGVHVDNFGQEEIDAALEYLLPSGVFDKKARPKMKHPTEVIPKRKAAMFGMDGRPFHVFFYTGIANYYELMHNIALKTEALKEYEDGKIASRIQSSEEERVPLAGSVWMDKKSLESSLTEKISDVQYENLKKIMERLAEQSYSKREENFIRSFRSPLVGKSVTDEVKPVQYDELGRAYVEAEGTRKNSTCHVKVWAKGTGAVSINGKDLLGYFPGINEREQILFPLQFTEKIGEVDFEAKVESGGEAGQAGALRLALSYALCSLVKPDMVEKMRLAGLLTKDPRLRERQKPGQAGARKKFTWKKR